MWLSRKLSQHEMQDVASAQDGTVTVEGGELAVFSSGEKREVKTAAPGGYEWQPKKGEDVLVVRGGTFGEEAYAVGGAAAAAAFAGETGKMIALKRISEYPYQCITEAVDVQQVANLEKKVPLDWITPDGMQVTAAFEEYARPLILDEVTPVYVNGTPRHICL